MTTITYDEYFEIYDTSPSTNWENGKILLSYYKKKCSLYHLPMILILRKFLDLIFWSVLRMR